jgi:hypothetical protein
MADQKRPQQQLQIVRLQRFENLVTLYKTLGGGLHENTASKVPVAGSANHNVLGAVWQSDRRGETIHVL